MAKYLSIGTVSAEVETLSYTLDGKESQNLTVSDEDTFTFEAALVRGENVIEVTAADTEGSVATDALMVTTDAGFGATITSTEGDTVDSGVLNVQGTISGTAKSLSYTLNGGEAQTLPAPTGTTCRIRRYPDQGRKHSHSNGCS